MKILITVVVSFLFSLPAMAEKPIAIYHYQTHGVYALANSSWFEDDCNEVRVWVNMDTQRAQKGKSQTYAWVSIYKTDYCQSADWQESIHAYGELFFDDFEINRNLKFARLNTALLNAVRYVRRGNEVEINPFVGFEINMELVGEKASDKPGHFTGDYSDECVVNRYHFVGKEKAADPTIFEIIIDGRSIVPITAPIYAEIGFTNQGSATRILRYGCEGGKG